VSDQIAVTPASRNLGQLERDQLAFQGGFNPCAVDLDFASRLGLDPRILAGGAKVVDRRRVAESLAGVLTRNGTNRSDRIKCCGRVQVAKMGNRYGLARGSCHDRLCPRCCRTRANQQGAKLRVFAEPMVAAGRLLFVTLTQVKRDVLGETVLEAIDRLRANYRRVFNSKNKAGRRIAAMLLGGLRVIELAWSPKGKRAGRGGKDLWVDFSGWHAHLHMLVQVADGVSLAAAAAEIQQAWLLLADAGECEAAAQYVTPADEGRIHELTKYPFKPLEISNPRRLREVAAAIDGLHADQAFGTWKGWRKTVPDAAGWGDKLQVSPCGLAELRTAAKADRAVTWDRPVGSGMVLKDGVDARALIATVARNPGLLQDLIKEARAASKDQIRGQRREQPTVLVPLAWLLDGGQREPDAAKRAGDDAPRAEGMERTRRRMAD
jgi:hypothetical protein